MDTLQV